MVCFVRKSLDIVKRQNELYYKENFTSVMQPLQFNNLTQFLKQVQKRAMSATLRSYLQLDLRAKTVSCRLQ